MTVPFRNLQNTESWWYDAGLRYLQGSGQVRQPCTRRNEMLRPL